MSSMQWWHHSNDNVELLVLFVCKMLKTITEFTIFYVDVLWRCNWHPSRPGSHDQRFTTHWMISAVTIKAADKVSLCFSPLPARQRVRLSLFILLRFWISAGKNLASFVVNENVFTCRRATAVKTTLKIRYFLRLSLPSWISTKFLEQVHKAL